MQSRRSLLSSSLPGALLLAAAPALASPMPDDDIGALLAREVDQVHFSTGLVAGVLDAKGVRVLAHGRSDGADARPLDGDTVFDIGSLTKLFTALILADMAVKGEVAMDDPLAKYVPAGVEVPDYAGRKITLLDLATYSPGLPGWPQNMPPLSPDKPFPDYSTGMLYQALSSTRLETAPGTQYVYSNFGYGLLGLALASRAGTDFESLVIARAAKPLGMDSTRIVPTPAMQSRYAGGHDRKLARVTSWNLPPAFAGAGAFALRLAKGAEIHAVEADAASLAALDRGFRFGPGLKRVTTERRDLFVRPVTAKELNAFDGVVFDPPRAGAEAQSKETAKSEVPLVAAVSCNPATLARDLAILIEGGYLLQRIVPIDQFLWSPHVEAVALLTKKKRRR